ncbi:MAG: hypothetical protein ACYDC1_16895 [Limisphaerales bacterium]
MSDVNSTHTAWRRWFGLLFLILSGGQLVWGFTWLTPHLVGRTFVLYWLACFVFAGLALLVAVLDLFAIRRDARRSRQELFRRTVERLAMEHAADTRPDSRGPRSRAR